MFFESERMDPKFWKGRKALITGSSGFIGKRLSKALKESGALVFGADLKQENGASFDITDRQSVKDALAKAEPEIVFHLASKSIIGESLEEEFFRTNAIGTLNLLEECESAGVKSTMVASSIRVYDGTGCSVMRESNEILGTDPYDVSKACADILSRSFARKSKMAVNVLRCTNTFGPADYNVSRIVPATVLKALKGEEIIVYGDGLLERDFMHVDDTVSAYLALAEKSCEKGISGEAFNFATGKSTSVKELVGLIVKECKSGSKVSYGAKSDRLEESNSIDISKAEKEIGWRPSIGLGEGIAKTVEWYRQNIGEFGGP